jgi:hypothetical protein
MRPDPKRRVALVTGGRDFNDRDTLFREMDRLHAQRPITLVVHGDAKGADRLADQWAKSRRVPVKPYPAAWDDLSAPGARVLTRGDGTRYNANAGTDRNDLMLERERPDVVVAFPGGGGTADMVRKAKAAGVPAVEPMSADLAFIGGGGL